MKRSGPNRCDCCGALKKVEWKCDYCGDNFHKDLLDSVEKEKEVVDDQYDALRAGFLALFVVGWLCWLLYFINYHI